MRVGCVGGAGWGGVICEVGGEGGMCCAFALWWLVMVCGLFFSPSLSL